MAAILSMGRWVNDMTFTAIIRMVFWVSSEPSINLWWPRWIWYTDPGVNLNIKHLHISTGIPAIKITWFYKGLFCIMKIPIPGKAVIILKKWVIYYIWLTFLDIKVHINYVIITFILESLHSLTKNISYCIISYIYIIYITSSCNIISYNDTFHWL